MGHLRSVSGPFAEFAHYRFRPPLASLPKRTSHALSLSLSTQQSPPVPLSHKCASWTVGSTRVNYSTPFPSKLQGSCKSSSKNSAWACPKTPKNRGRGVCSAPPFPLFYQQPQPFPQPQLLPQLFPQLLPPQLPPQQNRMMSRMMIHRQLPPPQLLLQHPI